MEGFLLLYKQNANSFMPESLTVISMTSRHLISQDSRRQPAAGRRSSSRLSHQTNNYGVGKLYESIGFHYTGVIEDGEVMMEMMVKND